jgi:hypothetical protein
MNNKKLKRGRFSLDKVAESHLNGKIDEELKKRIVAK